MTSLIISELLKEQNFIKNLVLSFNFFLEKNIILMIKYFVFVSTFIFLQFQLIGQTCTGGTAAASVTLNLTGLTANGDIGEPGNSSGTICFSQGIKMSVVGDIVSNLQITTSNGSWCSEANVRFGNTSGGAGGWQFDQLFSPLDIGPCGTIDNPLDTYASSGTPIFNTDASGCIYYQVFDQLNDSGIAQDFIFDSGTITFYGCPVDLALPLDWISINVKRIKEKHIIEWSTERETNTSHYIVERKRNDEPDFYAIPGRIAAQGNTSSVIHYIYSDENLTRAGTYIYRVKQYDLDGNFSYSKYVSITHAGESKIYLYPNPAKEITNLLIETTEISDVLIDIFDHTGKLVRNFTIGTLPNIGAQIYEIDLTDINVGMYTLSINIGGVMLQKKLIRID